MELPETDAGLPGLIRATEITGGLIDQRLPRFYANNVAVTVSPWDVRLVFCEIVGTKGEELILQPNVAVSLSPQTAKALLKILLVNIDRYEARIGEIKMPPQPPEDGSSDITAPKEPPAE